MADKNAIYQITGPGAFSRYGYDEQIPSRIYIYNDAISGERSIGRICLTLIKVGKERLGGTEQATMPSGEKLIYSSRVRTLVDAVYDWSRFDSLPRAYDWIRNDISSGRVSAADIAKTATLYGNAGTIRRLGALMEQLNVDESVLKRLQKAITPSSSKIPYIPGGNMRGRLLKRWGVIIND
jgi:predicted transcriptional regulator of viral defense system